MRRHAASVLPGALVQPLDCVFEVKDKERSALRVQELLRSDPPIERSKVDPL